MGAHRRKRRALGFGGSGGEDIIGHFFLFTPLTPEERVLTPLVTALTPSTLTSSGVVVVELLVPFFPLLLLFVAVEVFFLLLALLAGPLEFC